MKEVELSACDIRNMKPLPSAEQTIISDNRDHKQERRLHPVVAAKQEES